MTLQQVLFLIFGAITVVAALMVVTKRNVFHAALFMVLSFFGVAGLYVLLEAPFLAAVQLFIYVGGISVLIVFAIMLTRDLANPNVSAANSQWAAALVVAVGLAVVLIVTAQGYDWVSSPPGAVPPHTITILGATLVDPLGLMLPFEVASVLLLVALIGAVTLAREK